MAGRDDPFRRHDRLRMRIDSRPDVPALESVEARNEAVPPGAVAFFTVMIALMLGASYYFGKHAFTGHTFTPVDAAYILVISLAIVSLRISPRFLWPDLRWTTDSEGLREQGILRSRSIAWNDVTKAYTRSGLSSASFCVIQGGGKTITIPAKCVVSGSDVNSLILASIWQHLRGLGRSHRQHRPAAWRSHSDSLRGGCGYLRSSEIVMPSVWSSLPSVTSGRCRMPGLFPSRQA